MKRPRYADVYDEAFASSSVGDFVEHSIKQFRREPLHYLHVPSYIDTMFRTQSLAHRSSAGAPQDIIAWALAVSSFMRRRAARTITTRALMFLFRPGGPWMKRCMVEYTRNGLLCEKK